jgi:hypothetical protein
VAVFLGDVLANLFVFAGLVRDILADLVRHRVANLTANGINVPIIIFVYFHQFSAEILGRFLTKMLN